MTSQQVRAHKPLPVVLPPMPDELLSSWLHRHATFYGVTEPMLISWVGLEVPRLRALDGRIGLGQVARLVEIFRCDPTAIIGMTHTSMSAEVTSLVGKGRAVQYCRPCCDRHQAAKAVDATLKSWVEGWRITCPVCGSSLSEAEGPRGSPDTIRDTSPFAKLWNEAIVGEDIVSRHLRGATTPFVSPIATMRLMLILSRRRPDQLLEGYRKGWLLNELVPGFDAEAVRVNPSISKGATAWIPLRLRVALLAGLALASDDPIGATTRLRPTCRLFYRSRFDELAIAALGGPLKFSN
jgi:hypothetical protein